MVGSTAKGVVQLLFDLQLTTAHTALKHHRQLAQMVDRVSNLLATERLPATWAIADPANSCHTERILGVYPAQEIAIAAESSWLGSGAKRAAVVGELNGRLVDAGDQSLEISSLVMESSQLTSHLDVLVKKNINAICTCDSGATRKISHRNRNTGTIKPLRYGLWNLLATAVFPSGRRGLRNMDGTWEVRRAVIRARNTSATIELLWVRAIDLVQQQNTYLHALTQLLREIAELQRQDKLSVETISDTVARQRAQSNVKPTSSILRPAA